MKVKFLPLFIVLFLTNYSFVTLAGETDHRGRIQAQGSNPVVEKSQAWAQSYPLTQSDGLKKLDAVWNSLSKAEQADRNEAYQCAKNFINAAAKAGGVSGPVEKKCQNSNRKDPSARIDIVVIKGIAFKP